MAQTTRTAQATSPAKVAAASFIGTTVEYYDFFIYGTAAALVFPKLVFPKLFFPNAGPLIGALLSFATLGVGFLARPSAASCSATSATASAARRCSSSPSSPWVRPPHSWG
jgi:hypothetical protein